jgi:hypothetical protein
MSNNTSNTINACICELNISVWTARKYDKTASREIKFDKGAHSDDAARVNKNLMAGMANLKKVTDFVAATRSSFYTMTLPWSDSGQRLIPMAQFFELKQWINIQEIEFNSRVNEFLQEYPTLISAQAFQLGTLFNRNEYPLVDDIRHKFGFRVGFLPLPQAGDFRVDATTEVINEMEEQYKETLNTRIQQVNEDLWERLHSTIKHMADRMGVGADGKKNIFRDSMVDNAVDLCDLLKRLNITNDQKLEKARASLESALLGVDATELRKEGAREEMAIKLDSILGAWV